MTADLLLDIVDSSHVAEARRLAEKVAISLALDEAARGKVALMVTELATNLVKHAGEGTLVIGTAMHAGAGALQILSLDHGSGMGNVAECLRDGYSTSGSPGTGLGAIARLADVFDIYSSSGPSSPAQPHGTAVLALISAHHTPAPPTGRRLELGAVRVSKPGEELCGDAWSVVEQAGRCAITLADGLGHGPLAADASNAAMNLFGKRSDLAPSSLLKILHAGLQSTRGGAVAVVELDLRRDTVLYCGIGNISGSIVADGASRSMVSLPGIVGHEARRYQEFSYPWPEGAVLVMHSDGLTMHWDLAHYPGLSRRHPALIAGVLFRDHRRRTDDVTVVVATERRTT
jgi:anti-sigma regulatory factor (Ser/Thr protein kinase)